MATIFTTNSIAEMIIAGLLTLSITPVLLRLKKSKKKHGDYHVFFFNYGIM